MIMKKKDLSKVQRVIYFLTGAITLYIAIKIIFFLPQEAYQGGRGTPRAQLGMALASHPVGKFILFGLLFLAIYKLLLYPAFSGKTFRKKLERPGQDLTQTENKEFETKDNKKVNYDKEESKYDKLEKINELKEKNILSEEEFQEEKEKILKS